MYFSVNYWHQSIIFAVGLQETGNLRSDAACDVNVSNMISPPPSKKKKIPTFHTPTKLKYYYYLVLYGCCDAGMR